MEVQVLSSASSEGLQLRRAESRISAFVFNMSRARSLWQRASTLIARALCTSSQRRVAGTGGAAAVRNAWAPDAAIACARQVAMIA